MTASRDSELLVRAFLREGMHELPDRSFDAVRATVKNVRQRPVLPLWLGIGTAQPGTLRSRSPRMTWLLVAGLLVLGAAGAVVAGTLFYRNGFPVIFPLPPTATPVTVQPTASPEPTPSAPPPTPEAVSLTAADDPIGNYCGHEFSTEYLVEYTERTYDVGPDENVVLVGNNGTVLVGQRSDMISGTGLQTRTLNEEGIRQLAGLIETANLPNCQPVALGVPTSYVLLGARTSGSPLVVWSRSNNWELAVRHASAAETARVTKLADQLRSLGTTIPASGWQEAEWSTYVPANWRLRIDIGPEYANLCSLDEPPSTGPEPSGCLTWASSYKLPDGTPLLSFGTLYPAISLPERNTYLGGYRCGLVDRATVNAIVSKLELAKGPGDAYQNWIESPDHSENMDISLVGQLPGDRGCDRSPDTPTPGQPTAAPVSAPVDTCAILVGTIPDANSPRSHLETLSPGGVGEWTGCYAEVDPGDIEIWVRGAETPATAIPGYVDSAFGVGVQTEQIDGRTVYWNDCVDTDSGCTPGAALASGPHLLVVSWMGQNRADFKAWLLRGIQMGLFP